METDTSFTTTPQEIGIPKKLIFWAYENLLVSSIIVIFLAYVCELPDWKVYILVPNILFTFFVLILRIFLFLYDHGLFSKIWEVLKYIYNGTIIVCGIGINWMNEYKISKIIWILSLLNLSLFFWYIWVNVNFFKVFQELFYLVQDLYNHFTDPIKIMASTEHLLQQSHILPFLRWAKNNYLPMVMEKINQGDGIVLVSIVIISILSFVVGLLPKILFSICRSRTD